VTPEDAVLAHQVDRRDTEQASLTAIRERVLDNPENLPQCSQCAGTSKAGIYSAPSTCPACHGTGVDQAQLNDLVEDMWAAEWDAGVDRYAALFEDPTPGWWEP
jgi:hypothetical protein